MAHTFCFLLDGGASFFSLVCGADFFSLFPAAVAVFAEEVDGAGVTAALDDFVGLFGVCSVACFFGVCCGFEAVAGAAVVDASFFLFAVFIGAGVAEVLGDAVDDDDFADLAGVATAAAMEGVDLEDDEDLAADEGGRIAEDFFDVDPLVVEEDAAAVFPFAACFFFSAAASRFAFAFAARFSSFFCCLASFFFSAFSGFFSRRSIKAAALAAFK